MYWKILCIFFNREILCLYNYKEMQIERNKQICAIIIFWKY